MQYLSEKIADEILVMDAQRGRRAAFDMLVSRWQKRLWRHAFNLTGRTEAAWEVSQEAWLDIVRGLTLLNDPARFGSWAYRIVSNKAYDWQHRDRRKRSSETGAGDAPALAAEQEKHGVTTDIHDILRRLPARSRVILDLYYLEGFGVTEIAGILGIPEGTAKSRLHAARVEFRNQWESPGEMSRPGTPAPGEE